MQCIQDIGPIPRGRYTIGSATDHPSPFTLSLTPDPANDMCGRSGFLIHGDSVQLPGWASQGCIVIADPLIRKKIAESGIDQLSVVES